MLPYSFPIMSSWQNAPRIHEYFSPFVTVMGMSESFRSYRMTMSPSWIVRRFGRFIGENRARPRVTEFLSFLDLSQLLLHVLPIARQWREEY